MTTSSRIPALDGLRGVAIALVVFGHYIRPDWEAGQGFAGAGVDLFFALSGYLITGLLLHEHDATGSICLRRFYWRRACRILPAFVLWAVITYAATSAHRQSDDPGTLAALFTYTVNYWQVLTAHSAVPLSVYRWPFHELTVHAWSLAVEEQFYLLWPLILLFLKPARAAKALILALAAIAIWRALATLVLGAGFVHLNRASDTNADFLAAGCVVAAIERLDGLTRVRFRLIGPAILVALGVWLVAISRGQWGEVWAYPLVALLMASAVGLGVTESPSWLQGHTLRWLGSISYSLYLWHFFGRYLVDQLAVPYPLDLIASLALSLGIASASYYAIERPVLAWRDRRRTGTTFPPVDTVRV